MRRFFNWCATKTSAGAGHPITFGTAVAVIIVWAATGPLFGYSDTWQLVINTGTTIVTFLMVFLIQNSQNRDAAAMQAKLDELLRAVDKAPPRTLSSDRVIATTCDLADGAAATAAIDDLLRRHGPIDVLAGPGLLVGQRDLQSWAGVRGHGGSPIHDN